MTDFEMRGSEKSIKEYVKLTVFGGSLDRSLPMIICAALLTAIPLLGIIGWIMTQNTMMMIVFICALLFDVGIIIFLKIMLNDVTKKLMEAYGSQSGLVCAVSDNDLIIVRDNAPQRVINWEKIEEITEGNTAYYLRSADGMLVILEKDAVLSGTLEEAQQIISSKLGKQK